jgi:hypothetical protein
MPLLRGVPSIRLQTAAAFVEGPAPQTTYVFMQRRPFGVANTASELTALDAAERLVHNTRGARVYHDDDTLRVYQVPPSTTLLARR